MYFRQLLNDHTACASYLFGCKSHSQFAVVDPHVDLVDDYIALAEGQGIPIVAVLETHVQADHVSGALELARRTGARIYLHERADVAFPHVGLKDGDEVQLGNDYVRVLHTPGHSEDSVCYLVGDRTRGPDPWFALTGDTLFVGSAGRPDLHGDEAARRMAGELHASLARLLALPDDLEVYPAHFAGSACGKAMSGKPSSTLGFERRFNEALRPRDRDAFVAFMTTDLPPQPEEFQRIRAANRGRTGAAGP